MFNVINSKYELDIAKDQLKLILNTELNNNFIVDNQVQINTNLNYNELNKQIADNNNNIIFQTILN